MYRLDDGLRNLIELGKEQGYLTFSQVNNYLPDEAVNPEKLDNLLESLEELGLEIRDDLKTTGISNGKANGKAKSKRTGKPRSLSDEDTSRKIDDPVRMYLTQMGEIPLLTRDEEISLAKTIEVTRRRFRRQLLQSDFAARAALEVLQQVHRGELPFDRTIKVSMTEGLEKEQILGRMPYNLQTVEQLLDQNRSDFETVMDESRSRQDRQTARDRMQHRRRKMATLLEEMSLRIQRLQPAMKRLEQIAERMQAIERHIKRLKRLRSAKDEIASLQTELQDLMKLTLESPRHLAERVRRIDERFGLYEQAMRDLSGGNLRLVVSIAKKYRNRGLSVPGPDPGGQHRFDEGGREVRVPPRLQVLDLRHVVDPPGHHALHRRPGPHDPDPGAHDRDHVKTAAGRKTACSGVMGREPTVEEVASASGISDEANASCVEDLQVTRSRLDRPVGDSEDSYFGDFIEDPSTVQSPVTSATQEMLKDKIESGTPENADLSASARSSSCATGWATATPTRSRKSAGYSR